MIRTFRDLDPSTLTTVLCDADGTLFGSEEPAYDASAAVTNRFLTLLGVEREYSPRELQTLTNGKNFRAASADLVASFGSTLEDHELEEWVQAEKDVVTTHLERVLRPDPTVTGPAEDLAERLLMAVVTSSARSRMDACLRVTGLDHLFASDHRFSAEDSLSRPTSKPDPAIYRHAGRVLGVGPAEAVAVEDSVNGARSAVAAGFPTIGILQFVDPADRDLRVDVLREAGAAVVVDSWAEVVEVLSGPRSPDQPDQPGQRSARTA